MKKVELCAMMPQAPRVGGIPPGCLGPGSGRLEIGRGLLITGLGMLIVYISLTALMLLIMALAWLSRKPAAPEPPPTPPQAEEEEVAAIALALARSGAAPGDRRALRRAPSPWRALGRQQQMRSTGTGQTRW